MTLDEAIQHCRAEARANRLAADDYSRLGPVEQAASCHACAAEHEQLADWLEELQRRRAAGQGREYIDRLELKSLAWESGSPAVPDFLHGIGELREPEKVQLVDREEALAVAQRIDQYAWSDFTDLVESMPVWAASG